MDPVIDDTRRTIATLANLFRREKLAVEFQVLSLGACSIEVSGYDNWDGGTTIYNIYCGVPLKLYSNIELEINGIEQSIKNKAETLFRSYSQSWIGEVVVTPDLTEDIQGKAYRTTHEDLLNSLELHRSLMASASTCGVRVQSVNTEYQARYSEIAEGLLERNIDNPNPFADLWQ